MTHITFRFILAVACLAGSANAQAIYGVDGPAGLVVERAPGGNDPQSFWSFVGTFSCPPALPGAGVVPVGLSLSPFGGPAPEVRGDIAVDRGSDTIWVSDGRDVLEFDRFGTPLSGFVGGASTGPVPSVVPGFVTGLAMAGGDLWITDGATVALVTPPAGTCYTPTTLLVFGVSTLTTGIVSDLTWDPGSSSLWICSTTGVVTNISIVGLLGPGGSGSGSASIGPGGSFAVAPSAAFGLTTPLTGIAWDTAQSVPTFFVTDGYTMANLSITSAGVVPAAATFYNPSPVYPLAPELFSGIAFSARPITYGAGTGLTIGVTGNGQLTTPNPLFGLTMTDAPPTAIAAYLAVGGLGTAPGTIFGSPLYVFLPIISGPFLIDISGSVTLFPVAIPAGIPQSTPAMSSSVAAQWGAILADGSLRVSSGLYGSFALR